MRNEVLFTIAKIERDICTDNDLPLIELGLDGKTTFFSKRHDITETKTKTNNMTTREYDRMLETLREVNTLCAKAQGQYQAANGI